MVCRRLRDVDDEGVSGAQGHLGRGPGDYAACHEGASTGASGEVKEGHCFWAQNPAVHHEYHGTSCNGGAKSLYNPAKYRLQLKSRDVWTAHEAVTEASTWI